MGLPVSMEQMTEAVASAAAEDTALSRVAAAARASIELGTLADAVLDRFVRDARESGRSWTEIGAALGVSRQAAHLRFNDRSEMHAHPWPEHFSDRAREVIAAAAESARGLGHNYLGTEHVLLALTDQQNDLAGHVLRELGVTADAVRGHTARIVGGRQPREWGALGVAPRLKRSFELARDHADRLGHRCAGTEHLLLGLVEADGVAAQILSEEGITTEQLRIRVAHALDVDVSQLSMRRRLPRRRRTVRC